MELRVFGGWRIFVEILSCRRCVIYCLIFFFCGYCIGLCIISRFWSGCVNIIVELC